MSTEKAENSAFSVLRLGIKSDCTNFVKLFVYNNEKVRALLTNERKRSKLYKEYGLI